MSLISFEFICSFYLNELPYLEGLCPRSLGSKGSKLIFIFCLEFKSGSFAVSNIVFAF